MKSLYRQSASAAALAAALAAVSAPPAVAGGHYPGASSMAGPAQDTNMDARLSRIEMDQKKAQTALLDELSAIRRELDKLKAQLAMGDDGAAVAE
jgi:hypothetical protein